MRNVSPAVDITKKSLIKSKEIIIKTLGKATNSKSLKTNIGKYFFRLPNKHFPLGTSVTKSLILTI